MTHTSDPTTLELAALQRGGFAVNPSPSAYDDEEDEDDGQDEG